MAGTTLPPGPKARFPGEHLLSFQRNPTAFLSRMAREYGDVVYIPAGPYHFYLLNHPDLIKQVLVTENRNFIKGPAERQGKRVFGEGLLTSEGEFHLHMRRLIQPAFHKRHLETNTTAIGEIVARTHARWRAGETRDMNREMWTLTLSIIARTLFNSTGEEEVKDISEGLTALTSLINPLLILFADRFKRVPNPLTRRLDAARARLDARIYAAGGQSGDLFTLLRAGQYDAEGREVVSEQQMRDEALTVFLAGLGTTSYALSRTWYLLAQNPEAETRFHAELEQVLGRRAPSAADLESLVYTRRVFAEAMRLYPPSWITDRFAVGDFTAGGYRIPRGATIVLSQWVTHRDPRWYDEPLRFDPDRWIPERVRLRPEFSYYPFGGGPRLCIGEPLAWMAGLLVLSIIGQCWTPRLSPDHPLDLTPRFTWNPHDTLYMRLEPREPVPIIS